MIVPPSGVAQKILGDATPVRTQRQSKIGLVACSNSRVSAHLTLELRLEVSCYLYEVPFADDVVAIKHTTCFVASRLHCLLSGALS